APTLGRGRTDAPARSPAGDPAGLAGAVLGAGVCGRLGRPGAGNHLWLATPVRPELGRPPRRAAPTRQGLGPRPPRAGADPGALGPPRLPPVCGGPAQSRRGRRQGPRLRAGRGGRDPAGPRRAVAAGPPPAAGRGALRRGLLLAHELAPDRG